MARKTTHPKPDGYTVDNGEYVNPDGPPSGDPFSDPAKVERLKERTRDRILNRKP